MLLPDNQRQHRTLHAQKNMLPYAFFLVIVPCVSRSCEHFLDGFDLHILYGRTPNLNPEVLVSLIASCKAQPQNLDPIPSTINP